MDQSRRRLGDGRPRLHRSDHRRSRSLPERGERGRSHHRLEWLLHDAQGGGKTFSLTKVFRADVANQAIVIDYTITGTGNKVDFLTQPMLLTQAQGYTWYDNTTHIPLAGESKAGAETTGGFIAHVVPNPRGDLLFIKAFKDVAPTAAPPGH